LALVLPVSLAACTSRENAGTTAAGRHAVPADRRAPEIEAAECRFALDLYQHLANGPQSLCVSPFSVFTALTMTAEGARGETAAFLFLIRDRPSCTILFLGRFTGSHAP
jgi:serine protease inhibitor